jgi:hypothetical protein
MCPETFVLQLKEYRVEISSSSALMCGQGLLVTGRPACLATSPYRYQLQKFPPKLLDDNHWRREQECGTFMMVLRHILAMLCEMLPITPIMTDG